ncbi:aldo/keto reductase [Burkholderia sp. Bp9143]|uniref:aldo/keto reductase n=1 Tax=Burkholderia sp. Bp9143 TaxID=2184574 RepID=UPI000F5A4654|nr:aldo/keto reductase [Burkholderia sp. Bp9143]RQR24987.1 aldo/keto reductase [Burkholderia sp. Bp9143]
MTTSPLTTLSNGIQIPLLGLGVFRSTGDDTVRVVKTAIDKGYRLIDTAAAYQNEAQVGEGIRQSGIDRSELFVTTKLFLTDYGYEAALRAFDTSLGKLGLDYLDLYLLHWPVPREFDNTLASWRALEKLRGEGRVRAIGVCNFNPAHLDALIERSAIAPMLNQVELHPYLVQAPVRDANAKHHVLTQAWSPIGGVKRYWAQDPAAVHDPLHDPVIAGLAAKYGKTPAQVILRWHIEHGVSAIPKSSRDERLAENIAIFDFQLTPSEVAAIDALNCDERGGPDPEVNDLETVRKRVASQAK